MSLKSVMHPIPSQPTTCAFLLQNCLTFLGIIPKGESVPTQEEATALFSTEVNRALAEYQRKQSEIAALEKQPDPGAELGVVDIQDMKGEHTDEEPVGNNFGPVTELTE